MSLEDNLRISGLIDTYGNMLTEKQREMITSYYFDNLSLAEIRENCGVSRQSVKCTIGQAITTLDNLESKLKIMDRDKRLRGTLEDIANTCKDEDACYAIGEIIKELRG